MIFKHIIANNIVRGFKSFIISIPFGFVVFYFFYESVFEIPYLFVQDPIVTDIELHPENDGKTYIRSFRIKNSFHRKVYMEQTNNYGPTRIPEFKMGYVIDDHFAKVLIEQHIRAVLESYREEKIKNSIVYGILTAGIIPFSFFLIIPLLLFLFRIFSQMTIGISNWINKHRTI